MMEALLALLDPDLFLPSLLASLLAAVACGAIGPLVVSRRIVFLAGAIAHVAVGGVGAAVYLRYYLGWPWLDPVYGALTAAVAGALILALVQHRAQTHMDTLIGALWAVGMALGLILVKLTPGYHTELMSYLFGYLAAADWGDVFLLLMLDAVVIGSLLLCFKRLVAVGLDAEQVRLQNMSVLAADVVLLVLVALTVVALTRVVGLILVIALLSLPAATMSRFVRRLLPLMGVTILLNLILVVMPRLAVYGSAIAPEPAIIISAGACYAMGLGLAAWRRRRIRVTADSP
jgi:zinc transport system permease protein